jgi:nucleoside-diphosphate kinase
MTVERTLSIIKPDAVKKNITGKINSLLEDKGFRIVAQRRAHLSKNQAERFYEIHKERSFFDDLCNFMISGPVVIQVLQKENAVLDYRDVMGATNPANASDGTIRKLFADSIEENAVHGSDSLENAQNEIRFFFSECDIVG